MKELKTRYKMYKDGKKWAFAGITTLTLGLGVFAGSNLNVRADTSGTTATSSAITEKVVSASSSAASSSQSASAASSSASVATSSSAESKAVATSNAQTSGVSSAVTVSSASSSVSSEAVKSSGTASESQASTSNAENSSNQTATMSVSTSSTAMSSAVISSASSVAKSAESAITISPLSNSVASSASLDLASVVASTAETTSSAQTNLVAATKALRLMTMAAVATPATTVAVTIDGASSINDIQKIGNINAYDPAITHNVHFAINNVQDGQVIDIKFPTWMKVNLTSQPSGTTVTDNDEVSFTAGTNGAISFDGSTQYNWSHDNIPYQSQFVGSIVASVNNVQVSTVPVTVNLTGTFDNFYQVYSNVNNPIVGQDVWYTYEVTSSSLFVNNGGGRDGEYQFTITPSSDFSLDIAKSMALSNTNGDDHNLLNIVNNNNGSYTITTDGSSLDASQVEIVGSYNSTGIKNSPTISNLFASVNGGPFIAGSVAGYTPVTLTVSASSTPSATTPVRYGYGTQALPVYENSSTYSTTVINNQGDWVAGIPNSSNVGLTNIVTTLGVPVGLVAISVKFNNTATAQGLLNLGMTGTISALDSSGNVLASFNLSNLLNYSSSSSFSWTFPNITSATSFVMTTQNQPNITNGTNGVQFQPQYVTTAAPATGTTTYNLPANAYLAGTTNSVPNTIPLQVTTLQTLNITPDNLSQLQNTVVSAGGSQSISHWTINLKNGSYNILENAAIYQRLPFGYTVTGAKWQNASVNYSILTDSNGVSWLKIVLPATSVLNSANNLSITGTINSSVLPGSVESVYDLNNPSAPTFVLATDSSDNFATSGSSNNQSLLVKSVSDPTNSASLSGFLADMEANGYFSSC